VDDDGIIIRKNEGIEMQVHNDGKSSPQLGVCIHIYIYINICIYIYMYIYTYIYIYIYR
jgi:hypothetical protein